ncbi:MAG: hypothetical protein ACLF0G_05000 [Candidatus Brocadiia bacterium]
MRELAWRVAELAARPANQAARRRWTETNALRRPDRAPVWCRPVGAWGELLPEDDLACEEPWLRGLERRFRRTLIKRDIGDDEPVESHFPVPAVLTCTPSNVWGVDIRRRKPPAPGGAWRYDPPLKSEADFDRLRLPAFVYDRARTDRALDRARRLLGDILPVRRVGAPPLGATLCTPAAELRGLAPLMLDMAERPALVHRLMAHLRDAALRGLDQMEAMGLLTPNNTGPMTCSEPLAPEPTDGPTTARHLWAMANSQEFEAVSPRMWEEFLLAYQRPILARFGLVGYGCCEDLSEKMDAVLALPNLRIFVASAWTDLGRTVEKAGADHVIMWRQRATDVVFPDDTEPLRRHLDEGLRRLAGTHVQIVLRELQTLAGHPRRLHQWTRLAKDAAAKHT